MSAWSLYDQWLTTEREPVEDPVPGDPDYPRCIRCGAFLRLGHDLTAAFTAFGVRVRPRVRAEYGEYRDEDGQVCAAWQIRHRVCKRCGHDNKEVDA